MLKAAEKLVADNSPAILTGIGVTGLVTTAYLSGRASFKAAYIIDEAITSNARKEDVKTWGVPLKKKFELTWRLYIPAASVGLSSCAAIIGANRIGTRRAAAVAAAYSVTEKAYQEYKEKVAEKLGESKEREIRDEIQQDRMVRNPASQSVIITGPGEVLCYDKFTDRYFNASMETLKKAQNDLNHRIINHQYASLNDFYDKLGLGRVTMGEEMGWNADQLMELSFTTTMSDDERPCIAIDFAIAPTRHYFRAHP